MAWRPKRHLHKWTWAHRLTSLLFILALVLGQESWFPWFKGSLTATHLFDTIPFADPLAALEVTLASGSLTSTLLIGFMIVVLLYAFLGRVFCAWLCPMGLLLEFVHSFREGVDRKLHRHHGKLPTLALPKEIKYWLLAFFLLLALISSLPVFTTLSPINIIGWLLIFRMGPEILILGLIVGIDLLVPRGFCRSLCPLGALHSLIGRLSPMRIKISAETRGRLYCHQCTLHCPMGIEVLEDHILQGKPSIDDPECTRCGACMDVCPGGRILELGIQKPGEPLREKDAGAAGD